LAYALIEKLIASNNIGLAAFCGTLSMNARLNVIFYIHCKLLFTVRFEEYDKGA
jgi:hypothetical protein